ncbi:MAG: hypothetical protein V2I33_00300 [Kangiellaceae bacterium]|jgi:hypothetical protein|nr:hypothetical protein [Kangiellaceae bacterium]
MTPEEFSQWGLIFALSAASATLAFGLIIFYCLLQDKRAGIPVIIAFALGGIGRAAKYYLLSSVAVLLLIPFVGYVSYQYRKKKIIWMSWLAFVITSPIAVYTYQVMYNVGTNG